MDLQAQINDLNTRLQNIENNRWIFPVKLGQLEKKSLNNVLFVTGQVVLPFGGSINIPISGINPKNILLFSTNITRTSTTAGSIRTSGLAGIPYQVSFAGTEGDTVNYIVFITTNDTGTS